MPASFFRLLITALIFSVVEAAFGSEGLAVKCCSWPPVFERQFGKPEMVYQPMAEGPDQVRFVRLFNKVVVKARDRGRGQCLVSDYFLGKIWDKYLSDDSRSKHEIEMSMRELIPMSRDEFFKLGHKRLSGCLSDNPLHNAWWDVRMGEVLTPDCDHLLSLNSLVWTEGKGNQFGHFAIAIRQRGGSPDKDYIIDFRAPWKFKRRSVLKDVFSDELDLIGVRENYYDWLSTQTRHRHCDVTATFVPIHEQQLLLLNAYSKTTHQAGEYRFLKGNCASLGIQVINRLLPVDQKLAGDNALADLPSRKIKRAVKAMGGAVCRFENQSVTTELGRDISHRNLTLPAEPSRRRCDSFAKLLSLPEIN